MLARYQEKTKEVNENVKQTQLLNRAIERLEHKTGPLKLLLE